MLPALPSPILRVKITHKGQNSRSKNLTPAVTCGFSLKIEAKPVGASYASNPLFGQKPVGKFYEVTYE
jgi:hypothetical protein